MNYINKYIKQLPREITIEEIEKSLNQDSNYNRFIKAVKIYIKKNRERYQKAYEQDEELKEEFNTFESFYETLIIRKVYITLGMRFKFDLNFWFGTRKEKEKIYNQSNDEESIKESMNNYIGNCKVISNVLEMVFSNLNISYKAEKDSWCHRNYAVHVFGVITPADRSEKYIIDLENDLRDIQSKSRTRNFGILYNIYTSDEYENIKFKFSKKILEKIDTLINDISEKEFYSDEYSDFLRYYTGMLPKEEKENQAKYLNWIKTVIENIVPYENEQLKGKDRILHHRKRLREAFNVNGKFPNSEIIRFGKFAIYVIDAYYQDKNNFIEYLVIAKNKPIAFYKYDENINQFIEADIETYVEEVNNGLVTDIKIPGLKITQNKNDSNEKSEIH